MVGELDRIFDPGSIAVIGASETPGKRGYSTMEDLTRWGYEGDIYPVNPNYDELFDRDCYASVTDIPEAVDLAFIAIPAPYVPDTIRECGEKDVAGAVINTAGFEEVGEADLEAELAAAADETGVRLIGPNIQGVDYVHQNVWLLGGTRTTPGNLGMLTQSGNVGVAFSVDAADRGTVGFSYNIGVGNETDLEFYEYLRYLGGDERTEGVVAYVEGMSHGREFLKEARRVSREKPILAYKSGRTGAGKASAKSHTASLAGNVHVAESAYHQAGVQTVDDIDLVVPVAEALTTCPVPEGPNVAVLTDGGGHATMAADALELAGLETPALAKATQDELGELYELSPNLTNPVDVMGLATHEVMWYETPRILLDDPNIDALLITGAALGYEECWPEDGETDVEPGIARNLAALVDEVEKPIVFCSMWAELDCSTGLGILAENGVPVYERVDTAVQAIRALVDYGEHQRTADAKSDFVLDAEADASEAIVAATGDGRSTLTELESRTLLEERGAPVTPFAAAETADEAAAAATRFGGPVAIKAVSPDVVHKTDAGGVELGVEGEDAAREAFDRIMASVAEYEPSAAIEGAIVSPMVGDGIELIVGVTDDQEVGPVITCGVGGILVEAVEEATFRALPLTEHDAREMIADFGMPELLEGPRNLPAVDTDELVELLLAVSDLVRENPSIESLDLNPVIATADGLAIVDAAVELDAS